MHPDEVEIDADLVRRLLATQLPQWAELPLERVPSSGTDHAIYRAGRELSLRLPRIHWAVGQAEKEWTWLPRLAPRLPLAIPTPLAKGEPGEGYPYPWLVSPWIDGDDATAAHLRDLSEAAVDLARFIRALERIDTTGGPRSGPTGRGLPLAVRDVYTRDAIARSARLVDVAAVTEAWDAALAAPPWDREPVWIHGDLLPGNVLARDGRICAVIDWGTSGVGDPAVELIVAWSLFSGASRDAFRSALGVDDATWARGRGWALSTAIVALPYYLHTNPGIVARSRHEIAAVLADR
jgi:aminoglycoside phosphotransferase (APT) family kinase protein